MFLSREPKLRHILPCLTSVVWCLSAASAQGIERGIVLNVTSDSSIDVPEGEDVNITALCESVPNATYTTLTRTSIPVASMVHCGCHEIVSTCVFTLQNVSRSQSGEYEIYVNNTKGEHRSTCTKIDVMYAPVCSSLHNPHMSVIEGERVTFNLSVPAYPKVSSVQWLYQDNPINLTNPRYSGGTVAIPSLTIAFAARDDAGLYNFTANNTVGGLEKSNCTTNLTVNYGPDLDCFNPTATINEMDRYVFAINVTSYPKQSRVDWFKGNNLIDRNDTRFAKGNVNIPSLTLMNASRKDTGNYSVNVTNDVTKQFVHDCHTNLIVQYRPSCKLLHPTPYEINEGSSITINVTVMSLPPPTFVDWNLNGTAISRNNSHYSGGNVTVPSLTISDIRRNGTGFYSIQVTNIVGGVTDICRVFVRVLYRPECIILSNTTLWVTEYSSITINAAIDAVKSPTTVDWKLNNILVNRTGDRYTGGNKHENPSLNISGITRCDAGIYTLTALNGVGSVLNESNCNVNVSVQYIDNCTNRSYTVCENGTQTLRCSVSFLPSLRNVTWRKNGVVLDVSNPRYSGGTVSSPDLTISHVMRTDGDVYTCEVENVVGVAGCQITLDVFSRPDVHVPRRNIMLVEGQTSSIGCSVDMRVKPSPAIVHWFKDGVNLDTHFGRYSNGDIYNPSLTITDIRREDTGRYTCGAVNGVGDSQSDAINVTVEYAPTVLVKYNNYGFYLGSATTLWCYVDSYPLVSPGDITWVRDGKFVIPSTSCSDVRPNLRMCKVDTSTAGTYMCRAHHRLASVNSADISVNVRDMCPTIVDKIDIGSTDDDIKESGCVSGRLTVQLKGTSSSGTVCGRTWTSAETEVVCGMKGYQYGDYSMRGGGLGPIHLGDVTCLTGARTLNECRLSSIANCSHDHDLWLTCCKSRVTSPVVVETVPTTTTTSSPTAAEPNDQCKNTVIPVAAVGGALLLTTTGLASILLREKCSACSSCGSCEGCNLGSLTCNNEGENSLCACRSNRVGDSNSGDEEDILVVIRTNGGTLEFFDKDNRQLNGVTCMCDLIRRHECPNSIEPGHINAERNNLGNSCQCAHTPHCDCNSQNQSPTSSLPPLSTNKPTNRPPEQLETIERMPSTSYSDTCDEEEHHDYADIHTEDETSRKCICSDPSRCECDAAYEKIEYKKRQTLQSSRYSSGMISTRHGDTTDPKMASDNSLDLMPPIQVDTPRGRRPFLENGTESRPRSGVSRARKRSKPRKQPTAQNDSTGLDSDDRYTTFSSDLEARLMQNTMPTDYDVFSAINGHVPRTNKDGKKKRNRSKSRDHNRQIDAQSKDALLYDTRTFRAKEDSRH
ncbi:hemicentin-1-like isoform X1 [Haliotis rufescens]|uniref:hemicentin-1-like isoform X1 n=1 Tax=Haliotis rufescens TaxID=6454 RepID=UPI00201EC734|nr:hemicentin-1-like isoform X1 [Haliotis rufescens]